MDGSGDFQQADYEESNQETGSYVEEESESEESGSEIHDDSKTAAPAPKRTPFWIRLYKDHDLRKQRLEEKRAEIRKIEEEEQEAYMMQVSEDRNWVEKRRVQIYGEEGPGETIDERMSECGPWWDRLYVHAEEKRDRLKELQETYLLAEEDEIEALLQAQRDERERKCAIFLEDRDDSEPWHERLYTEADDRRKRAEERDTAKQNWIRGMSTPQPKKSDQDEDDEEKADDWHVRLHADHGRRIADLNLRRKQNDQEQDKHFQEMQEKYQSKKKEGEEESEFHKPVGDRLFEHAAEKKAHLEREREQKIKEEQEYQDEKMARWMTETQKSRECWSLKEDPEDGGWYNRLHNHSEARIKAFKMERVRMKKIARKQLQAGRRELHEMVQINAKRVPAPMKDKDPFKRLYTQAKEAQEHLKERQKSHELDEIPAFKPDLEITKEFKAHTPKNSREPDRREIWSKKLAERKEKAKIGPRLFEAKKKQQAALEGKRQKEKAEEAAKYKKTQEDRWNETKKRIAKVAPKLLEDKETKWHDRLSKFPTHWTKQQEIQDEQRSLKDSRVMNVSDDDDESDPRHRKKMGKSPSETLSKGGTKSKKDVEPADDQAEDKPKPLFNFNKPGGLFGLKKDQGPSSGENAEAKESANLLSRLTMFNTEGKLNIPGKAGQQGLKSSGSDSTLAKQPGPKIGGLQSSASVQGLMGGKAKAPGLALAAMFNKGNKNDDDD